MEPELLSHDALQDAEFGVPISEAIFEAIGKGSAAARELRAAGHVARASELEKRVRRLPLQCDNPRAPSLTTVDPDGSYSTTPPPSRADLAAWLYGLPPGLSDEEIGAVLPAAEGRELGRTLSALGVSYLREGQAADPDSRPVERQVAARASRAERAVLARALIRGLERRASTQLTFCERRVYAYLVARKLSPAPYRVCELCLIVFFGRRRTRHCRRCAKAPSRVVQRSWHRRVLLRGRTAAGRTASIALGDRLVANISRNRAPGRTVYSVVCECGREFVTADARRRYCDPCGSPRVRTARYRLRSAPP